MILRSDVIRKGLLGREPTDRLPSEAYAPDVSGRVFAAIAARAASCVGAGHAAIADAVYGKAEQRAQIAGVAVAAGVPFSGIWLHAPLATRMERVSARSGDASDADAEVVMRQAAALDRIPTDWCSVRADRPAEKIADEVLAMLGKLRRS